MKQILLLLFVLSAVTSQAKNYYISSSGNNDNNGLSPATAWKTIDKVNSFSFAANDSILFKRNDKFYGGIIVSRGNLNYGAYGSGAKPLITGLSTIRGWVNLGGNIWEAPTTNVKPDNNLVVRNGVIQQVGRYPNADAPNGGYLTNITATNTSITGPAVSSGTNWTGAEVAFRSNRWTIDRQTVVSHSGRIVSFAKNPATPKAGFGYFFQRDSKTLDKDGEWWQDGVNAKLRMYFANNNPGEYTIQASTIDTLFKNGKPGITVTNLLFSGANKAAILNIGAKEIIIKNCDVINSGAQAITAWFCTNVTLDGCTTNNSLGAGIRVRGSEKGIVNLTVRNCSVHNTCLIAGMESGNTSSGGVGLLCKGGDNIQVVGNIVINSGWNALEWQGNNATIMHNFIDSFCSVRDDGGGIYTWEAAPGSTLPVRVNRNIIGNIILNGIGASAGTNAVSSSETSINGIYLDGGTRFVHVEGNTVGNISANGLHGNDNAYDTIIGNTFFNTKFSISQQRFAESPLIRGMVIKKNIMYPYRFRYRNGGINTPVPLTKEADIMAMGLIDSNYYSLKSAKDTSLITATTYQNKSGYTEGYYNFSYLKGAVGIEAHSTNVVNTGVLEYNATNTPKTIYFKGSGKKDVFGKVYNNSVTIPAWSSIILIPKGAK